MEVQTQAKAPTEVAQAAARRLERSEPLVAVADDEADVLEFVSRALRGCCRVEVIDDARAVEETVAQIVPDVLLLDIRMPGRDGLSICRALRRRAEFDHMPIVFFSGYNVDSHRTTCYQAGADDFLAKPLDLAELKAKISVWTSLSRRSADLVRRNRELEELATRDELTGLATRRHILELLDREMARFRREGEPFSVILMDVDDFKRVNDAHGHAAGDAILRTVGGALRRVLRAADVPARYGGDEFLILLPATTETEVERVCRRLQELDLHCQVREEVCLPLSCSIGAATVRAGASGLTEVIDAADLAMLLAKNRGKGGYEVSREEPGREDNDHMLAQLQRRQHTVRDAICQLLEASVQESERRGDLLSGRRTMMLQLAEEIGRALDLPEKECGLLRNCVRLTNTEKFGLCSEAVTRRGGLTEELRGCLTEACERNLALLRNTGFLGAEADALAGMYERFDGSGFPAGLKGEAIPRVSRALRVVSAYSLLREGGPHTDAHDAAAALREMRSLAGQHFDPAMVEHLAAALRRYDADGHAASEGRVLVVDDNPHFNRVVQRCLERSGYSVSSVETLAAAQGALAGAAWDVVLLDIMMPGGSGFDLLDAGAAGRPGPEAALLFLSARHDREAVARARQLGARGYVVKPVSVESLRRALVRCRRPAAEEPFFVLRD